MTKEGYERVREAINTFAKVLDEELTWAEIDELDLDRIGDREIALEFMWSAQND